MAFPKLKTALSGLESDLQGASAKIRQQADSIRETLSVLEVSARRTETSLAESLDRSRQLAQRRGGEITSLVDELLMKTGTQFDDLRHMLENASGPFVEELQRQLDLLELGGSSVEKIIHLFGDAQIEGQRLREVLQGADFGQFERQIQELMRSLRSGVVEVEDLLRFLNERGGDFGKTVAGWIEALKKGEISLERFRNLIDALQNEFRGTDLENFLDEIEDALDQGRL